VAIDPEDVVDFDDVDVMVTGDSSASDGLRVDSTHTATPEVSHPGESQSNGKAEKAVGDYIG